MATSLLLLAACGGVPFAPTVRCEADGFGPIYPEDERSCECLSRNVRRARALLVERGLVQDSFDFSSVAVYFHARAGRLDASSGAPRPFGRYEPEGPFVELDRFGGSLAHEFLHHFEMHALGATRAETARHPNWDERGYTAATNTYWQEVAPGALESCP
jgi:hypothetical protein